LLSDEIPSALMISGSGKVPSAPETEMRSTASSPFSLAVSSSVKTETVWGSGNSHSRPLRSPSQAQ
jgi:hypothetical protein